MSAFMGHTFGPADVVTLDGNQFEGCTFEGCTVMFGGGEFAAMHCNWHAPKIVMFGPALGALSFIRSFGQMQGGAELVERVCAFLRGGPAPAPGPTAFAEPGATRH
ncbi:hypothetical protein [Burkholderia gladioli]|uniref:hypothetical protein n=2 Tax=Burkholderia gladioli TaxID=28095 RepID=UPI00163EEFEE|nr:hypothetical protein [Burkholderia gladioli]